MAIAKRGRNRPRLRFDKHAHLRGYPVKNMLYELRNIAFATQEADRKAKKAKLDEVKNG
jgi:hypothetical protein